MPLTDSPLAFDDCKGAFDKALAADRGVKIIRKTIGEAVNLIQRLNRIRQIERRENKKVYPENSPMHGRSVYDVIAIRREDNVVFLQKRTENDLEVIEI